MKKVIINGRMINPGRPIYFIAEAGVNHNGRLDLALEMVKVAKKSGADAIKFQTFKTESLNTTWALKPQYYVRSTGNNQTWFQSLKKLELSRHMHKRLMEECASCGIDFLSTPYDPESVDLLDSLGVPAFKVSSTDVTNLPILAYIGQKGKPVLLSTGMSTLEEIDAAVSTIQTAGNSSIIIMHCTSEYPAVESQANLAVLRKFKERYCLPVGYSDHTLEPVLAIAAAAIGVQCYEKHFTLDRKLEGPDHQASLEPDELAEQISLIRRVETALGSGDKVLQPCELANKKKMQKSIVALRDIEKGEKITGEILGIKRPGTGLKPRHLNDLIGMRVIKKIAAETLIDAGNLAGSSILHNKSWPLFISTTFLHDGESVFDALIALKGYGIKDVELGSNHKAENSDVLKILPQMGLRFLVHNYFPPDEDRFVLNISSTDESIRQESLKRIKGKIDFAASIEAMLYTFHSGFLVQPEERQETSNGIYDFLYPQKTKDYSKAWLCFMKSLEEIARHAEYTGIRCAVETSGSVRQHQNLLLQKYREFEIFLAEAPDNLGVNFNLSHCILAASFFQFKPEEVLKLLEKRIFAVELSHTDGIDDLHLPVMEDDTCLNLISEYVPDNVPIVLEYRNQPINTVVNSFKTVNKLLNKFPFIKEGN